MKQYEMALSGDLIAILWNGELVCCSHKEFFDDLSNLLAPGMKVVLNMEKVDFIDSAGIRFLICLKRFAEDNGALLTLCNSNGCVENALRLTGRESLTGMRSKN